MPEVVTVPCQECGVALAADSPELRLELTDDGEPIVYCVDCWEREFGEEGRHREVLRALVKRRHGTREQ
jgi:hypothetical protein